MPKVANFKWAYLSPENTQEPKLTGLWDSLFVGVGETQYYAMTHAIEQAVAAGYKTASLTSLYSGFLCPNMKGNYRVVLYLQNEMAYEITAPQNAF